jgi:hypothetical protein
VKEGLSPLFLLFPPLLSAIIEVMNKQMNWVRVQKVCCGALAGGLITLNVMAMEKPETNLQPNYYEPHEAPSNYAMPQWPNRTVVASTATSGTVNTISYTIS